MPAPPRKFRQGGIVGTAMMLAECSGVARPSTSRRFRARTASPLARWLQTFPSYGYILSVAPANVAAVIGRFAARGIAAAEIGAIAAGGRVAITDGRATETIWDFAREPLIGCGRRSRNDGGARMKPRLRIAILAHSTNPRGGVVHALELGDALCRLGHEATVHAPDAERRRLLPRDALRDRERRRRRRSGTTSTAMVRDPRSPIISVISSPPGSRRLRRLARPGRDFRQCAGDAEASAA